MKKLSYKARLKQLYASYNTPEARTSEARKSLANRLDSINKYQAVVYKSDEQSRKRLG